VLTTQQPAFPCGYPCPIRSTQAQALATYPEEAKNSGWEADRNRILPMLAGLQELVPWLRQWHDEKDPAYGIGMGDFFADHVVEEARLLGKTVEDLKAS